MSRFVDDENATRLPGYRKQADDETALLAANVALESLEPERSVGPPRPTLFVFGLPRSGTTLCAQLLAACLDIAYVSNLAARFWLAPDFGMRLSRLVLGDRRDASFASDYGKTEPPWGVHEFAYFWHRWLAIERIDDLLRFGRPNRVDWLAAGTAVQRIVDAARTPVLFKTNFAAQFLADFAHWMPQPLFIHVERDPADVALSILAARRAYYGRDDAWWATHPPEYPTLAQRSVPEQIAGQVVGLRRAYAQALASVDERLCLRVAYAQLCTEPGGFLAAVQQRVQSLYDVSIPSLGAAPALEPRERARRQLDETQSAVLECLAAMQPVEERAR